MKTRSRTILLALSTGVAVFLIGMFFVQWRSNVQERREQLNRALSNYQLELITLVLERAHIDLSQSIMGTRPAHRLEFASGLAEHRQNIERWYAHFQRLAHDNDQIDDDAQKVSQLLQYEREQHVDGYQRYKHINALVTILKGTHADSGRGHRASQLKVTKRNLGDWRKREEQIHAGIDGLKRAAEEETDRISQMVPIERLSPDLRLEQIERLRDRARALRRQSARQIPALLTSIHGRSLTPHDLFAGISADSEILTSLIQANPLLLDLTQTYAQINRQEFDAQIALLARDLHFEMLQSDTPDIAHSFMPRIQDFANRTRPEGHHSWEIQNQEGGLPSIQENVFEHFQEAWDSELARELEHIAQTFSAVNTYRKTIGPPQSTRDQIYAMTKAVRPVPIQYRISETPEAPDIENLEAVLAEIDPPLQQLQVARSILFLTAMDIVQSQLGGIRYFFWKNLLARHTEILKRDPTLLTRAAKLAGLKERVAAVSVFRRRGMVSANDPTASPTNPGGAPGGYGMGGVMGF